MTHTEESLMALAFNAVHNYAKLAVREALERAIAEVLRVEWTDRKTPPYKRDREPNEIATAIRAMIEEYK